MEYPLHQLICLGHLHVEIHTTLLNSNIDVRILAQGCCVAIISLSLLVFELDIERDEIRKAFSSKKLNDLAPFSLFLVFWNNSHRRPLLDSGCLLEKGV